MNQQVAEDIGGTIYFDPTEVGRPTSATVILKEPDGTTLQASASATVDAVNTTLSAAADAGDTTITLTAVTSIVKGRTYQLSNGDNFIEWVRVRGINTSTKVVTLDEPLGFAYSSGAGSTFVGTRVSYLTTPTHAADRGTGYEAIWSILTGGTTYVRRSYFDVVRTVIPDVILRPDQFRHYSGSRGSGVREKIEAQGDDFESEILYAQEDVITDIRQRDVDGVRMDPSLIRNFDAFRKAIAFRLILNRATLAEGIPKLYLDRPQEWIELRRVEYTEALTEGLSTCGTYDADDSGVVTVNEKNAKLGSMRWTR